MPFSPPRLAPARHHPPTGKPSWTRLLLSGPTNSWKSGTAAQLSADQRITGMYWLEIGDGEDTAEEYGRIPGVKYQVIEHDGTFLDIYNQLVAHYYLALEAQERGEVWALTADSMSGLNEMLTDMGDARARKKKVDEAEKYKRDGATFWSAEYDATISPELRGLIKKRHAQFMRIVHNWPGPVVMLSAEDMATVFENGQPTNRKDWWLSCRKDLPRKVTAHVRVNGAQPATVVKLRSGRMFTEKDIVVPFDEPKFSIATLIFDWVGCEAGVSRAPADRVFDADQDMPDEVRVDRVGNRMNGGPTQEQAATAARNGGPMFTADQAKLIRESGATWATKALELGDVDTAGKMHTTIAAHWSAAVDMLPHLSEEIRERLGVHPDTKVLSLADLLEQVVVYVGKHKHSPLAPLDDEDAGDADSDGGNDDSNGNEYLAAAEAAAGGESDNDMSSALARSRAARTAAMGEPVADSADLPAEEHEPAYV